MGREELKSDFILLNAGYARHNGDWNWKNVHSPFARIHCVTEGTARIVREDGVYNLKKGGLYLTPSYVRHSYECDAHLELYYMHIYESPGKKLNTFDVLDFPVEVSASPLDLPLIERLLEINPGRELQHYDPSSYDTPSLFAHNIILKGRASLAFDVETQGILKQLVSRFMVGAAYKNENIEERILKSLHYIHRNIDHPIDIEFLAGESFLTKDHFIRLFKREMNCTPGKYIARKKIEAAQLRILIDGSKINDIAYGLGFDNISYFNRLFTKITGESPGKYKKKMLP